MKSNNKINHKIESEWFQKNIAHQEEIYVPIAIARKLKLEKDLQVAVIIKKDDSRILSLKLHLWLIEELLKNGTVNRKLLEEFLMGGALGDGGISNRRKEVFQHIFISSNMQEYKIWEKVCTALKIPYRLRTIPKRNSAYLIISNYYVVSDLLHKGLFGEYAKRRIKLIAGLKNRIETRLILKGQIYRKNKDSYTENINLELLEVN
jgi:hypothetical protein